MDFFFCFLLSGSCLAILINKINISTSILQGFPIADDSFMKSEVLNLRYKAGICLLDEILKDRGLTQSDLAYKLNVKSQQINKYCLNKQKMSLDVAKSVSAILKCQIEDLYEWHRVGDKE